MGHLKKIVSKRLEKPAFLAVLPIGFKFRPCLTEPSMRLMQPPVVDTLGSGHARVSPPRSRKDVHGNGASAWRPPCEDPSSLAPRPISGPWCPVRRPGHDILARFAGAWLDRHAYLRGRWDPLLSSALCRV